jgi:hypothetical protein
MRCLHPVFNVVKLTPSPADPIVGRHPTLPPPPEVIDGKEEYLVEESWTARCSKDDGSGSKSSGKAMDPNMTVGNMLPKYMHPTG